MRTLVQLPVQDMISGIVDTAVRQAVILQRKADAESAKQSRLREIGEPYNFTLNIR